MSLTVKPLADGQLGSSKATLYTVPSGKTVLAGPITLVNTGSSPVTVNVYLNLDGSNSRRITVKNLPLDIDEEAVINEIFTLDESDLIEGDASSATAVDYVINGIVRE